MTMQLADEVAWLTSNRIADSLSALQCELTVLRFKRRPRDLLANVKEFENEWT